MFTKKGLNFLRFETNDLLEHAVLFSKTDARFRFTNMIQHGYTVNNVNVFFGHGVGVKIILQNATYCAKDLYLGY